MADTAALSNPLKEMRKGVRFLTTNSEIAFILAEGTRVTTELRRELAEK